MEKKTEVKVINVDCICEKCNEGRYRPTDQIYLRYPPQYPHKCTICNDETIFDKIYPYLEYESV